MSQLTLNDALAEEVWRDLLTNGDIDHLRRTRRFYRLLPSEPRCAHCNRPFKGIGGFFVKHFSGIEPSKLNPRFCNDCELFAKEHPGGAEVDLAMLFADIRGSTSLAEKISPKEFASLIDLFYQKTSDVLIRHDALIEKLMGDEVTALFVPGYAGAGYTQRAVQAAEEIVYALSHSLHTQPKIPVGIGIHKGKAFVGAVGAKNDHIEITALGDAVNIAARLSQTAKPGEIIISEDACSATEIGYEHLENRQLSLKGRNEPVKVRVIHPASSVT